jgi:Ser-tRNA(Ala) deacylase AlaX
MESVSALHAQHLYTVTHFLMKANQTCNDKCVVDFQSKDISAAEKECANACIKKHMVIFKDIIKF